MRNTGCILEDHANPNGAPHRWIFRTEEKISVKFGLSSGELFGEPLLIVRSWHNDILVEVPLSATHHADRIWLEAEFSLAEGYYLYQLVTRKDEQAIFLCPPRFLVVSNEIPRTLSEINLRSGNGASVESAADSEGNDTSPGLVYSIVLDRFAVGKKGGNAAVNEMFLNATCPFGRHGGNLNGLLERLPYIKGLGVETILLNPVYLNENLLYHGYHPLNLLMVDPLIGTAAELRSLVNAAHSLGMRVMIDVVCNHLGDLIDWGAHPPNFRYFVAQPSEVDRAWKPRTVQRRENPFSTASLLPYPETARSIDLFHGIDFPDDPFRCRLFELLEDWRTEEESVRDLLIGHVKYLISEFDFDGVRYDAVRHVEPGFWRRCLHEVGHYARSLGKVDFVQVAEHAGSSEEEYSPWRSAGFGSMLQFPLSAYLRAGLKEGTGVERFAHYLCGNEPIEKTGASIDDYLFLDNHDQTRLLSDLHDTFGSDASAAFQICLTSLLLGRLCPVIYYGTEQDFSGALGMFWDPNKERLVSEDCYVREDMFRNEDCLWLGGELNSPQYEPYSMVSPTYQLIRWLSATRQLVDVRRPLLFKFNEDGVSLIVFRRFDSGKRLMIIINHSDVHVERRLDTLPLNSTGVEVADAPFIRPGSAPLERGAIACLIPPYGIVALHLQCGVANVH